MVSLLNQKPPQETDSKQTNLHENTQREKNMMSRQQSQLENEMEIVKSFRKLTPEERRKELRRDIFRELRNMEMERRERAALTALQRQMREKEEKDKETERLQSQKKRYEEERRRPEAKQREEEKRRENEQKALEKQKQEQLKKARLEWKKVMMVDEEPITRPRFAPSDLKKEQRRCGEAQRRVEDESSFKSLTSKLKGQEQSKRKTLFNNWVGEPTETNRSSTQTAPPPSTEITSLKSETTPRSRRRGRATQTLSHLS
ncbi:vicilin-like seed storage protein At2g18540 isoform X2 [Sander lucioperca]|uniref:vicilin-like seed storage protein At2g18540 isoform X2 n=1 Tax=Sander lucioperca TaxID=283035 RepID=UPI00125D902E|nr:vicilin-like seed storage protein At2g18540 isoform X2 [Sander lucioperca]